MVLGLEGVLIDAYLIDIGGLSCKHELLGEHVLLGLWSLILSGHTHLLLFLPEFFDSISIS